MKRIKFGLISALPLLAVLGAPAFAGSEVTPQPVQPQPVQPAPVEEEGLHLGDRLTVSANLRTDVLIKKDGNGDMNSNLRTQDFEIKLTAKITDTIRAVITANLDRDLIVDGQGVGSQKFDVEQFIKEAYIEIRQVGGQPIAFIIGKQEISFGQHLVKLPMTRHENPVYDIAEQEQVIGFTVALDYNFFNLIDKVEMSVFETEAGDLHIGKVDGASIRLSKQLTDKLKLTMSYMHKGDGDTRGAKAEDRGTVGLIYASGPYTAWVEGVYMTNNPVYGKDANFGVTGGVSRKLGPGEIAVEASYIQNSLTQLGIGYQLGVTKNLSIGPEVRYTWYDESQKKEDGVTVGVSAVAKFGPPQKEQRVLFGAKSRN